MSSYMEVRDILSETALGRRNSRGERERTRVTWSSIASSLFPLRFLPAEAAVLATPIPLILESRVMIDSCVAFKNKEDCCR